jgi:hypothetical protein
VSPAYTKKNAAAVFVKLDFMETSLPQEREARYREWFLQQVQVGIDQMARGEFIEEDEMDARVEEMLRS